MRWHTHLLLDRRGTPVMIETPDATMAMTRVIDTENVLKNCEFLGKYSKKIKHGLTDEKMESITGINITVKAVEPGKK